MCTRIKRGIKNRIDFSCEVGVRKWKEKYEWFWDICLGTFPFSRHTEFIGIPKPSLGLVQRFFLMILQFFRLGSLSNFTNFSGKDENRYRKIEFYVVIWLFVFCVLLLSHTKWPSSFAIAGCLQWSLLWDVVLGIVLLLGYLGLGFVFWCLICKYSRPYWLLVYLIAGGGLLLIDPLYVICLICGYRLLDIFSLHLGRIFVDEPKNVGVLSRNRSLSLFLINYFEIIIVFAIMYLATRSIRYTDSGNIIITTLEAFYFSAVTITTLGCSNMVAKSSLGMGLVVLESILGLTIIALVLHELLKK